MEMNRASLGEILNSSASSIYFTERSAVYFNSISILFRLPAAAGTWYFVLFQFVNYFIYVSNSTFLFSSLLFRSLRSPNSRFPLANPCHYRFRPIVYLGFRCRTIVIHRYRRFGSAPLRRSAAREHPMHRLLHLHLDCKHSLWLRN